MPRAAWVDFGMSHFLAGLICGAFVFFGLTMLSVVAWHPRLVMATKNRGTDWKLETETRKIRTRLYWYRLIAIGAPLVAMATLVNFRTSNTLAVSCLSVATIICLAAVAIAIGKIGQALILIERC